MKKVPISIAVITRNRINLLKNTIESLLHQLRPEDELIVVDNASSDATGHYIKSLAMKRKNILYVYEDKIGYSFCRNKALKVTKINWIAFIDDDCIAFDNWLDSIRQATEKHKTGAAIIGRNYSPPNANIVSKLCNFFDEDWKSAGRRGNRVINYETLDTKNIVYNRYFLGKFKIKFDTTLRGGEDADLGLQIKECGGNAYNCPEIKVQHKDPDNYLKYLRKLYVYHINFNKVAYKWNLINNSRARERLYARILKSEIYINLNPVEKIIFLALAYGVVIWNKGLEIINPPPKPADFIDY